MFLRTLFSLFLFVAIAPATKAADPAPMPQPWSARWIYMAGAPASDYGVYHFRRVLELPSRPASFVVHVSGDSRYQLFVNGERVVWGPARGDLFHWRYETVDIASHLRVGKNVLAAVVWNFGRESPMAQVSYRTAFMLHGDTPAAALLADTNRHWKCTRNDAYRPLPFFSPMGYYYVAGPGDEVDAARYPWGWEQLDYDDSKWQPAAEDYEAALRGAEDSPSRWMLVPRPIPLMEERPQRLSRVRQSSGITLPDGWPAKAAALRIPANTKARIVLDQNHLTTAYPELIVSGGRGGVVNLQYAESLWVKPREKGNRDEVEGKIFFGSPDLFRPDGGEHRMFRPLWWRTYRYVELTVETKDDPLTLEDFRGTYTGYPFERRARFDAGSGELAKILDTGWRTARLCAHETYMDTPYYEQLQYAGDTRIQALVSLYMTGDGRLMRNAIELLNATRTGDNLTLSCAPSNHPQYIPPFSLWWIGMVHDYFMYQDDPAFVKEMLPGMRAVLSYFAAHQKRGGSLGPMGWWNFVDWVEQWRNGVPPVKGEGSSAPLDLQLLLAYDWAAGLESALGSPALAEQYRKAAAELRPAIVKLYGRPGELFSDTPQRNTFSQHTNSLAVLAGAVEGEDARKLVDRMLKDPALAQASVYFRHYLHSAVNKAGEGDRYLDLLEPWRAMLARGLTTWAERPEPSRSDCHAWGASPNFELFRTVLGIDSAAPGFRRVVVRPFLGSLAKVSGAIPHPQGEIAVSLAKTGSGLDAQVSLPAGIEGELIWHGEMVPLKPGLNKLHVK